MAPSNRCVQLIRMRNFRNAETVALYSVPSVHTQQTSDSVSHYIVKPKVNSYQAYRRVIKIANNHNRHHNQINDLSVQMPPSPSSDPMHSESPNQNLFMLSRTLHNVRHCRQRYDWDCGLSCIQMVLPLKDAKRLEKDFQAVCRAEGFGKSTWTIDLCYVLRRYNISHTFYTLTLGAYTGYRDAGFYSKVFVNDEQRVNLKFAQAEVAGLKIYKESLLLPGLLTRLNDGPAIVLMDSSRLDCAVCKNKRNRIAGELRKCIPIPLPVPQYVGHYVVLCGYDLKSKAVYYRNPASYDHYCVMSLESFEESRRAFGTDEDIIFIRFSGLPNQNSKQSNKETETETNQRQNVVIS